MHQWRAFAPRAGSVRQRVGHRARLFDDVGDEGHHAAYLLPPIGKAVQEDRDIVVGVRACITARARAEQHAIEAFELGAVDYLLKPVSRSRLAQALDRIRRTDPAQPVPKVSKASKATIRLTRFRFCH